MDGVKIEGAMSSFEWRLFCATKVANDVEIRREDMKISAYFTETFTPLLNQNQPRAVTENVTESDKNSFQKILFDQTIASPQESEQERSSNYTRGKLFRTKDDEPKAPYSTLEKNGLIKYNGVTFICDNENKALCLGDMTKTKNVLTISLSGGGYLKVNRNNLEGLAKAIGMFSPEDVNLILRAIAQDKKVKQTQNEIAEMGDKIGEVDESDDKKA